MNARNLGMSKMKCLLPNSRGTLQMDSLLKQRALVTFPISFHFAVLKDGGSWLGTQVPSIEAWKSEIINRALGSSRKRSLAVTAFPALLSGTGGAFPQRWSHAAQPWAARLLPSCFCIWVSPGLSKPSWFSQPFHKPHNTRCISGLLLMCPIRFFTQFSFGTQVVPWVVPSPPPEPAGPNQGALPGFRSCPVEMQEWGSCESQDTHQAEWKILPSTLPSAVWAYLWCITTALMWSSKSYHRFAFANGMLLACYWSLTANGISFGGYFSAYFPRKERQWIRPSLHFSDIQLWFLWSQRKDWKSLVHPRTKWKAKDTNSY